jgi:hypothetical protein
VAKKAQAQDVHLVQQAVLVRIEQPALAVCAQLAGGDSGQLGQLFGIEGLSHHPMLCRTLAVFVRVSVGTSR